jgi:hypothetical protein
MKLVLLILTNVSGIETRVVLADGAMKKDAGVKKPNQIVILITLVHGGLRVNVNGQNAGCLITNLFREMPQKLAV